MKNIFKNKKILSICLIIIMLTLITVFLIKRNDKLNFKYDETDYSFLKNYNVNEYVSVFVNQEAVAKIYITEYKNLMINDTIRAYSYLNEEYKNKKFSSYENFVEYCKDIQTRNFFEYSVKEYNITSANDSKIIYVRDNTDNLYIFKEKSIMQYEVYLDNNTVEIK